jgi:1-acyl-sn-glycerol-3-phosphate acyltransferase
MTSVTTPPVHRREPWYQAIRWTVFPVLRVWFRWRFDGLERIPAQGPAIIACNHASYLDPLANAYAVVRARRRPRFLAKQELFKAPGISWAMRGTGQIPVARGTHEQRASLLAAAEGSRPIDRRGVSGGDRHESRTGFPWRQDGHGSPGACDRRADLRW